MESTWWLYFLPTTPLQRYVELLLTSTEALWTTSSSLMMPVQTERPKRLVFLDWSQSAMIKIGVMEAIRKPATAPPFTVGPTSWLCSTLTTNIRRCLVVPMAAMIGYDEYDFVLGSRILAQNPMAGGMPRWKYVANRGLTLFENLAVGFKLSEYHTGLRAYSRELLEVLPLERNSDDFVFDNQMIVQALAAGARIGELSCPTRYATESSSIDFRRSVRYGLGVLQASLQYRRYRSGRYHYPYLEVGQRLDDKSAILIRWASDHDRDARTFRSPAGARRWIQSPTALCAGIVGACFQCLRYGRLFYEVQITCSCLAWTL